MNIEWVVASRIKIGDDVHYDFMPVDRLEALHILEAKSQFVQINTFNYYVH